MRVQIMGVIPADPMLRGLQEGSQEARMREALEWIAKTGALLEGGHFRFGKGRTEKHGRKRVDSRRLFNRPFVRKWFVPALAENIPKDILDRVDIVAGPPTLGTIVASDLADFLSGQRSLKEPEVEALYFGRNWDRVYELHESDRGRLASRRVLLVDDVRHRGLTFLACYHAIVEAGGEVIATAELIDRGMNVLPLEVPNHYVGQIETDTLYTPEECPMCHSDDPAKREFTKF